MFCFQPIDELLADPSLDDEERQQKLEYVLSCEQYHVRWDEDRECVRSLSDYRHLSDLQFDDYGFYMG